MSTVAEPIPRPREPQSRLEQAPHPVAASERLLAIDALRGLVIAWMALDHVRDYFSDVHFAPTDLDKTSYALFFTRWITHYCAPTFIFLAGVSARITAERSSRARTQRFLLTRGLWLIVVEFTVVSTAWAFNFHYPLGLIMQVIWVTGLSMCILSGLIALPDRVLGALAVIVIAGHNSLDGIEPEAWGRAAWLWHILHVEGPIATGPVLYPLIPWFAVMAAGYVFGKVFALETARRRRVTLALGASLTLAFIVVRGLNVYGDLKPWSVQLRPGFTLLSFLNVTKYPPSLAYLLMTLGPALLALVAFERAAGPILRGLSLFGRVPLFAYVVHIVLAHAFAGVVALALGFGPIVLTNMFVNYPERWGFGLGIVYCAWLAVLAVLYPLCVWFAGVKRRRKDWWLSYL
jgi:uncharacterized membrane protein